MSQLKLYRVTRKSFINGHLLVEGETIEYGGKAGDNLQLIDSAGNRLDESDGDGGVDNSAKLAALQQQYEEIFGVKPHHKAGIAKLSEEIDAKRKELGIN